MKRFVILLLLLFLPVICFGFEYDINGYDNEGNYVYGELDVDHKGAYGYIYTQDGESKRVNLEWTEKGYLEGYDEDGNYYDLQLE